MKKPKTLILLVFSLFSVNTEILAQSNPNPCDFPNVNCQNGGANGIIFSFGNDTMIYAAPGTSNPFWVGIGDTITGAIDTSQTSPFLFVKLSGPGEMLGSAGGGNGSYVYYNDIKFTEVGVYVLKFTAGNGQGWEKEFVVKVLPRVNFCVDAPGGGCGSVSGNQIFAVPQGSNVIPVDAVLPINVGVIDSLTGMLDSTFSGTIYAEKETGPGMLYGTLSMSGQTWFTFNNLRFSEEGSYVVRFFQNGTAYRETFIDVEVVEDLTGIEVLTVNGVKVFPNPIGDEFRYSSNKDLKGSLIEVFNIAGQLIHSQINNESGSHVIINSTDFKRGTYFVKTSGSKVIKVIK